jgi:hypothetical protein
MKVLKTIRLRGGKAGAFIRLADLGSTGLKQVETCCRFEDDGKLKLALSIFCRPLFGV